VKGVLGRPLSAEVLRSRYRRSQTPYRLAGRRRQEVDGLGSRVKRRSRHSGVGRSAIVEPQQDRPTNGAGANQDGDQRVVRDLEPDGLVMSRILTHSLIYSRPSSILQADQALNR
jgi:hypothetical protein